MGVRGQRSGMIGQDSWEYRLFPKRSRRADKKASRQAGKRFWRRDQTDEKADQ